MMHMIAAVGNKKIRKYFSSTKACIVKGSETLVMISPLSNCDLWMTIGQNLFL